MLGTPNRGSFAIPLALCGLESVVQWLARLDARHDRHELLAILDSFVGSYQMLPSPRLALDGDDHVRLFRRSAWGDLPVSQARLARGRRLQEALHRVASPERLVYVAGCDQETPHRIRIDAPGRFSYRTTMDGDGRVPHELGLLNGVRTYWIREKHGDLAKCEPVLESIHELLRTGETIGLESDPPVRRGLDLDSPAWKPAAEIDPLPEELEALLERGLRRRGRSRVLVLPGPEMARLEALALREWLGTPGEMHARTGGASRTRRPGRRRHRPMLRVDVVCGDIMRARGDVFAVGHYRGVLPQNAEWALDRAVSGPRARPERFVITDLTRRGVLRGDLGEIDFFPWAGRAGARRLVAVAGMQRLRRASPISDLLEVRMPRRIVPGEGGGVSAEHALLLAAQAAVHAAGMPAGSAPGRALRALLESQWTGGGRPPSRGRGSRASRAGC